MRNYVLGIVTVFAILGFAALAVAGLGLMPTNADASPPALEKRIAMSAVDAAVSRRATHSNNPVPANDQNLIEGMKIYTMNCSVCHGTLDNQPSTLEHSFYPPVPQLILDPSDDPEWHTYYVVRNGIRYTGMPAWNHTLSDADIWKVAAFLARVGTLPTPVQDYWKQSYGVSPRGLGQAR